MGAPKTESCRRQDPVPADVTVAEGFEIATQEVTQTDFLTLMEYNPSFASQCADCPVDSVSWHEAAAYAVALSNADGLTPCYRCEGSAARTRCTRTPSCTGYRLPTDIEWEYAARAGTRSGTFAGAITSCMSHDEVADTIGWFKSNSGGASQSVASKEANPWGLYDTAGNVAEWTDDGTPAVRQGLRGGSWYHNSHHMRVASRLVVRKDSRLSYAGIRLVRSVAPAPSR